MRLVREASSYTMCCLTTWASPIRQQKTSDKTYLNHCKNDLTNNMVS